MCPELILNCVVFNAQKQLSSFSQHHTPCEFVIYKHLSLTSISESTNFIKFIINLKLKLFQREYIYIHAYISTYEYQRTNQIYSYPYIASTYLYSVIRFALFPDSTFAVFHYLWCTCLLLILLTSIHIFFVYYQTRPDRSTEKQAGINLNKASPRL